MENDLYYPERVFEDSFTFGKWVPLICADVAHLRTFEEIYNRPVEEQYSIPRSNGPFFFRNHPINHVAITGYCHSAHEILIEGSKTNVILIIYLDDGSGSSLKCSKFTFKGAHKVENLIGRVFEVQGYIIHHPTFGREIRFIQITLCSSLRKEISIWSEALKLRRAVLSKHWNYGVNTDSILSSNPGLTAPSCRRSGTDFLSVSQQPHSQDQEMAWRLGSLAPLAQVPVLYCSFDRPNSVISKAGSIIETAQGVTLSQTLYKSKKAMSAVLSHVSMTTPKSASVTHSATPMNSFHGHHQASTSDYSTNNKRLLIPPKSPTKPLQEFTNLNTVFYGNSYREMSPFLTHKIPRTYSQGPKRILRK